MADQDNHIEVRMKVVSGKTADSQYFDYRPSFFADIVRIEWELETMEAALEPTAAEYLIKHGYAERLKPEKEPELIVHVEEPLVVETIDNSSSAPSVDATASTLPPEPPAAPPSPPPSQTPPAAETSPKASGGGKQKQKEKSK